MINIKAIKFVGTGGIFDYEIGNSSLFLETEKGNILIDCGYTVYSMLVESHLIESIDYIMITHIHGDHVGSIHPLILHLRNRIKKIPKIIYTTEKFKSELHSFLKLFLVNVENYVQFENISNFDGFGYIDTTDRHVTGMSSFSYYFEERERYIYFSGDLGDIEITKEFLVNHRSKPITVFHETSFLIGKAHVYYKELEDLAVNNHIYAYHCNHKNAPNDCTLKFVADFEELTL